MGLASSACEVATHGVMNTFAEEVVQEDVADELQEVHDVGPDARINLTDLWAWGAFPKTFNTKTGRKTDFQVYNRGRFSRGQNQQPHETRRKQNTPQDRRGETQARHPHSIYTLLESLSGP